MLFLRFLQLWHLQERTKGALSFRSISDVSLSWSVGFFLRKTTTTMSLQTMTTNSNLYIFNCYYQESITAEDMLTFCDWRYGDADLERVYEEDDRRRV